MSAHTPGEWSCADVYPPRVTIHVERGGRHIVLAECFGMEGEGEREANARLFAAAKDLLAACINSPCICTETYRCDRCLAIARATA